MLIFRLFLLSVTSLLVYADDLTTSIPDDLPVLLTIAPQQDDTDASSENQRQGRVSLHAELPASKAKREQALRNILAAKRRQVLGQRQSDQKRSVIMPRLRGQFSKEAVDVLEVQESRPGLYITAPSSVKGEIDVDEEASEPLTKTFIKTTPEEPNPVEGIDNMTSESPEPIKQTVETRDLGYDDKATVGQEARYKPSFGISRATYLTTSRNNTQNMHKIVPAKSSQIDETDPRKNNNTVVMSESLYKHFRPVESNVPIEEMTQFLYFGQKLSPETQNTTSSNSLEVTPTLPPIVNSRRRFSMKRFSTTTPVPVPKLEEIINEEMNIAVERQTVERNKIPKMKNVYRSPSASSLYYRRSPVRPVDPTIVSNVIGLPETKNVSEGDTISKSKNDSHHEEHSTNPSAHASLMHQVHGAVVYDVQDQGKGNPAYRDSNQSGNSSTAVDSSQKLNETNDRGYTVGKTRKSGNEMIPKTVEIKTHPSIVHQNRGSINGHSFGYPSRNTTSLDSEVNNLQVPVQIPTTDIPEREAGTTLRIIVADNSDTRKTLSEVNNDRVNLASPGGSPPVVLPAQQHVYAYTITNVTRLLRNYSGPGVSSKEEGEQQGPAPAGTAEISDGSSSGIVTTQSRSDLSAGPAAEGVTTLEGDQVNHSSGDYGPRSDADAASRGATSIRTPLEVNKSVVKVVDSEVGESIRAEALPQSIGSLVSVDPKNEKNLQEDLRDVDQRMLQKSASAVLNQRPSNEPVGDRFIGKGTRRRDQPRGHHLRVFKNQGRNPPVKSEVDDSVIRQLMPRDEPNKSTGVRSSTSKTFNESPQSTQPTDNVEQNNSSLRHPEDPQGVNGMRNFEENFGKITPDMLAEQPMKKSSDMMDHHAAPSVQDLDITMPPLEVTTLRQEEKHYDKLKSDGDNKPDSLTATKVELNSSISNFSDIGATGVTNDRDQVVSAGSVEARSRTTDRKLETATTLPKETITVQSTMPPSLFPVTPRIISNVNKPSKDVNNSTTEDSVTEVPVIRTTNPTDADRPFGIAKDLSPSEIQQMYRSSNTMEPDVVTTLKPEVQITTKQSQDEGEGGSLMTDKKFNASLSEEDWNGQRTVSIDRSPEVRGRNLSDKTRDKDDILPIMHLYNTTSIFNETSSLTTSPSSHGTDTEHVILPVVEKNDEMNEKGLDSVTTALPTTSSVLAEEKVKSIIHDNAYLPGRNPGSQRLPDSLSNKPDNRTRQKEDQGSREPVGPSYSNKGNNSTTGTGTNRTRYKYAQPTSQPKSNVSAYNPTFNTSEFGASSLPPSLIDTVNFEVVSKRPESDPIATQETVAVVSYILATLVVFPIAVGVGLILRRLIIRNRKMLEESDTSSEISCRKDALNLESGDFKTSIEKAITKLPRIQHLCHEAEKPPPPPTQESRWEFPRDKLRLQTVLGQGNFGQVWKAEADNLTGHQGTTRLVAVKTVKEGASSREKEDLVRELEIMQQLGNHPNVVTLLGCCTEEEPHYLILEYVMYGKLLAYLRDHRTRQDFYNFSEDSAALTSRDLTVFGYCVARGMEYLASKKIIHRDLAARNVLVDHNKLCKIADFGMSRFANEDGEVIETRHGRNALPIRWMAPESLIYSLFTTKTDVWSFGILMWEIVTLGSTPYPDMAAREVMRNVQSGYRLERPSHCRSELFRVISRCWQADPDRRPDFQVLRRDLAQLLEDNMNGHYVDLESFASECTD